MFTNYADLNAKYNVEGTVLARTSSEFICANSRGLLYSRWQCLFADAAVSMRAALSHSLCDIAVLAQLQPH